jgi:hypothetical protein
MSVYFRAIGDNFDVEAFLAGSSLEPDDIFHRGEPGSIVRTKPLSGSGFCIQISEGFGRLHEHTDAATDFLREHELELARLQQYPGVIVMLLDFGYDRRPEAAVQCDRLPHELLALAGSLGIGIELSLYPAPDESEVGASGDTDGG